METVVMRALCCLFKLGHGLRGAGAEIAWIGEEGGTMVEMPGTNLI